MQNTKTVVRVGIADMNIAKTPQTIRTSGLGSCVGVVLYDASKKVAGMVHVMLPDSQLGKSSKINVAKFADTGIYAMMEMLKSQGVRPFSIKAKIAGGAQMFQFGSNDTIRIGPRNVEAVKAELKRLSIPIIAEDTGGSSGRTIEFDPETCILHVRTVNAGTQEM
ncbi:MULTISPECIES: chemotaxis protein CheD [unclassified Sporosarcina]|uniref:chemotaxis protein CheD n=1 Tax=unclassified Sporosarcina TaxID=2647733 RepID=UPI00203FCF7B|nr:MULTISPECIES: chemotaxis protein CheD [unclassified Sporosarcina]GKV64169.1 chemoreceptor glutamine deamidase CheD [Sporosarcina sp. NCCP-2331]GLB54366.1 chemoreceptor glutamine deamidase CheD [Sporosarcina sp. NCCP-2378]